MRLPFRMVGSVGVTIKIEKNRAYIGGEWYAEKDLFAIWLCPLPCLVIGIIYSKYTEV